MSKPEIIPIFPLTSVLLPYGRIPLQIFEPRYLDLVSDCLKNDTGFGVVWLRQGSEIERVEQSALESIKQELSLVGTYAKIVDWDSLPNGLLGITIEGEKKFSLLSHEKQRNNLNVAQVEWIDSEPKVSLSDEAMELYGLLQKLLEHPHMARLNIDPDINDAGTLAYLLTQLLPIDEKVKFELLSLSDPHQRLEKLFDLLDSLGQ